MADQPSPAQLEPIPQPPGKFIIGNLPDVMGDTPILDLMELAREYGPIYQLAIPGRPSLTVISSFALVDELCDDRRFDKAIGNIIEIARETVGDGLFPLIMIGPGTGLAPFRGFLQERAALKGQGKTVGTSLLYFGCRNPDQDYIYEDELQAFVEQGVTELSVAFSRLDGKKTYVQDKIKQDREKVWQQIEQGAIIYICGDASKMAPDVRKAFASIYQDKTSTSEQEANTWLDELTAENRYLVDVWGISLQK